jgi:chromosome segregation ATPase
LSNTSQEELDDLKDEYKDITGASYVNGGTIHSDFIDDDKVEGIVHSIETLTAKIVQANSDYNKAKTEMEKLDARISKINEELEDIKKLVSNKIEEFEKKYVRFIQEASWTSEEYTDNNLYYLDAETTLHKSAQPKVSYTINVIELS